MNTPMLFVSKSTKFWDDERELVDKVSGLEDALYELMPKTAENWRLIQELSFANFQLGQRYNQELG